MEKKRPTLKKIAQIAGVSINAVSLALKNSPEISETTREKIRSIAEKLSYKPDPMLSSLAAYRTHQKPAHLQSSIAYINSWSKRNEWRKSPAWLENFDGAKAEAERFGYRLEEFWVREPGLTIRRCNDILAARNIRGILVGPRSVALGRSALDLSRISAVAFGYLASPALHRVTNNQFDMIMLAMRRVRKLGYRRIGLAMPKSADDRVNHQWMAAFLAAQMRIKPVDKVPLLISEKWTPKILMDWYSKHRPEVIFGLRNYVMPWLTACGLKMPEEVGYVELNRLESESNLAGIIQNSKFVGIHAIRLLVGMMQRNECGIPEVPVTIMIEPRWAAGPTLRNS